MAEIFIRHEIATRTSTLLPTMKCVLNLFLLQLRLILDWTWIVKANNLACPKRGAQLHTLL